MKRVATYEISHRDPGVRDALAQSMDAFHSYLGDPLEAIDDALARHPDFVMGHLFKATVLMLTSERRFQDPARASIAAATALKDSANDRERGILAALDALVANDWALASQRFDRVLMAHATDAFSIQAAQLIDFFRGDSLNLRNRIARVLPAWSAGLPGYSFVMGMYAFGLEECNQYVDAERAGRLALDLDRRDAWAVHAVAHVMEMQGRVTEGIDWLESRARDWSPDSGPVNGFAYHNWWHLALFHFDRGDAAEALRILDQHILSGAGDLALGLVDATALLWRLKLLDVPVGDRFEVVAERWEARLDREPGYCGFNDFHAALAFAATGRSNAVGAILSAQHGAAKGEASETSASVQQISAAAGAPLVAAISDYAEGRYAEAAWRLADARDGAARFGGSHAQRDLITLTLIDAARRGDEPRLARHYLNERLSAKPESGLGWRLLERLS